MKNLNNKGFMLTETLVVASFVVATLVFLYAQFRTINRSYDTTFKYNNVEDLYALGEVSKYIKQDGFDVIVGTLEYSETGSIEIGNCSTTFFAESGYCANLFESLNIEYIVLTDEDLTFVNEVLDTDTEFPEEFKTFIKAISYDKDGTKYRLIAKFKNGTYATLVI